MTAPLDDLGNELRELHAENKRLRAALDEIDAHCPRKHPGWAGLCFNDIIDIVSETRAAIKPAEPK